MKRYIRFDSIGGASGDMILAALVSIGANTTAIEKQLNRFFDQHIHIIRKPASDSGLHGINITVCSHDHPQHDETHWPDAEESAEHTHGDHQHGHSHRGFKKISELIKSSDLSEKTKNLSIAVFLKLAEAEAEIHDRSIDTVHFHEVGAWDSVADIVGSCIALEQLEICGIACGALPSGTGTIKCAHGIMPNPAPATQNLLSGTPIIQTDEPFELVTPTGAAILTTWMHELEKPPIQSVPSKNGYGFGSRTLNGRPNVLRATIMQEAVLSGETADYTLTVLETNLDDCNPEWLGTLLDDLLEAGALDAWQTPIIMKKNRPAIKLSVLAANNNVQKFRELIYRSTTTFGIRSYSVQRSELEREFIEVKTPWGQVPIKCGILDGRTITCAPEHDACARLAAVNGCTVKEVSTAAIRASAR